MTRIRGPVITRKLEGGGYLRTGMGGGVVVGDRYVPPVIELGFPGVDGQPELYMVIEVLDGVPRCTELTIRRIDDGREVRPRDLGAVQLDDWIEQAVAVCSGVVQEHPDPATTMATFGSGEDYVQAGIKTIRDVRKGSRRPLTDARKKRVADVYNAQETGGIEAVQAAFSVSRSTAVRYIRAAREAGLIETRD